MPDAAPPREPFAQSVEFLRPRGHAVYVCNLYSMTKSREALVAYVRAMRDRTGNQPPLPDIFPDQLAPVVRTAKDGVREVATMRWGFPPPPAGKRPVTNVRNLISSYWRGWLDKPEFRCLAPATSFVEYTDAQPKIAHWFALGPERPLFCFAGIWRPWTGVRGKEEGEHLLFSILTTEANDLTRPVHAAASPVILTGEDLDIWLHGSSKDALALAKPFPAERMQVVLKGPRADPGEG
jgi:putative SOS response-associated peptidase YedK